MNEELHDLVGAYALDALDDIDKARFVRHLEQCQQCRLDVSEFSDTASHLAMITAEAPPPALRDRVLREIATSPQVARSAPSQRRLWPVWASAAAIAILALVGWSIVSPGRLISGVLQDPAAVTFAAVPTEAGSGQFTNARVVFSDARQAAVLVVDGLAAVPDDRTYELWLIDESGPVAGGTFVPIDGQATVLVTGSVRAGVAVAVTEEPAGGVESPTGEVLFIAELDV